MTYDLRFVPLLFDALEEIEPAPGVVATKLAAEGFQLANVIQSSVGNPPVLLFVRPSGMVLVDVEVPDDTKIQPVGVALVPGNGQGPRRGFR
jgi:hypothetical protein